ncbi:MAG: hypothetical protein QXX30_01505 [Candidatus Aenigmatarchaeota archaeon]
MMSVFSFKNNNLTFIDLDGVVADFLYPIIKRGFPYPKDYWFSNYSEEQRKYVRNLFEDEDFIFSLPPIEGAIESIYKLAEIGVFAGFLTSRTEKVKLATLAWIDKYFPDLIFEVFFDKNKAQKIEELKRLFNKDSLILVEDAPHFAEEVAKNKNLVFLVDYPYNRNISNTKNIVRVSSLKEVIPLIKVFSEESLW